MAEYVSSTEGKDRVPQDVLSIGFHLVQGEQLSASYATAAEEAGEDDLATFFRELESTYKAVRDEGTQKLLRMEGTSSGWIEWWWRPPW